MYVCTFLPKQKIEHHTVYLHTHCYTTFYAGGTGLSQFDPKTAKTESARTCWQHSNTIPHLHHNSKRAMNGDRNHRRRGLHARTEHFKANARPQIWLRIKEKNSTYAVRRCRAKRKILEEKHNHKQHQNRITPPQRHPSRPSNARLTFTYKLALIQTNTQRWTTHSKTTHSNSAGQIIGDGRANFASIANNRTQTNRVNWPTGTQTTEAAY